MGRIRLYIQQSLRVQSEDVLDSQGIRIEIPFLRRVLLAPNWPEGAIHPGRRPRQRAPLTVFPRYHWQHFTGDIEWLTPVKSSSGLWLTNITGKTGGFCPCRVGRVEITAFDLERPRQQLAPVPVIALFEQQASSDDRILVGLHGSILQGRRVVADPDGREAWLEDR